MQLCIGGSMNKKNDFELSLAKLFLALWKRLPIILLVFVVTAGISYYSLRTPVVEKYIGKASFLVPKEYYLTDREIEYVEDSKDYSDETTRITALSSASMDAYCSIAAAPTTCEIISSQADLPYTGAQIAKMVSASQENANSQTIVVQINSSSKEDALLIAQAYAEVLPDIIDEISPNHPFRVLNAGSVSTQSSGGKPDTKKIMTNASIAAAASICLFALLFVVKEYTGKNLILASDVKRLYPQTPILSIFSSQDDVDACKRLRTNLLLSLPSDDGCRMVGLTAAHPIPEKDDMALGLGKALAELGDRVLLVDADLRAHRIQELAKLQSATGLSEIIRSKESIRSALQTLKEGDASLSFLASGNGADNASELLDCRKILPLLQELKADYDFILLNLESIGSSVDASSIGKNLDGVLVAFKDEGCTRNQLEQCMSQLEYAAAKVLGFVEVKKKSFIGRAAHK